MAKHSDYTWISLSDMMTSLMMIFLFLSVLFMYQLQKRQAEQQAMFVNYKEGKQQIYNDLNTAFASDFNNWQMTLDKDLTIKFTNPDVLFDYYSSDLTPKYTQILDEFIPKYLAIIDKPEYKDKITEIRIEGHTGESIGYMDSIKLSQNRANNVLEYVLNSGAYGKLNDSDKAKLRFWITANGLGYGRAIDNNGEYVYNSHKDVSDNSRRVEFRIVTSSDSLVNNVINNLSK